MEKSVLKFYIFLLITFIIFINIFPGIFVNINNGFSYIKTKSLIAFSKEKNVERNIYKDKGNVIIMFDDGWKTQYTIGYNYMKKKDIKGCIAVITSLVGETLYSTSSDLYEVYSDGWDILNHTYSHAILTENSLKNQIDEIIKVDNWLEKNGYINNKILIYPEGEHNSNTSLAMKKLNYISGRGVIEDYNYKNPSDLYDIKVKNVLSSVKPEEVNSWVNKAMREKLTLILLFHKLQDDIDDTMMKYKVHDFYQIIDYINMNKANLNIITYSEWLKTIEYYNE